GGDIGHAIGGVANGECLRVEPAVAFDQTHTVCGPTAQPVGANEISTASDLIWILLLLVGEERIGEGIAVGSPHITPAGLPGVNGIESQVCGILGGGIGEGGDVQLDTRSISTEILTVVAATASSSSHRGVDVVDVVSVILCDVSAQMSFQMGVCLVERKGHVDGVGLLLSGDDD